MTSGRFAAIALALLLCVAGSAAFWSAARSTAAMDFYQIWIGARMARETRHFYDPATATRMGETYLRQAIEEGASPLHIAVARYRRNLEMFSTPFLYTIYSPLRGPYERDLLRFQIVVFVSFLVWVAIFTRLFGWELPASLLLLAFLLLAFEPLRSDVRVGNVNHVVLALLALGAGATVKRQFVAAGALLAIATMVKPHVVLIIPVTYLFWSAQRRWRDLVRHAAGAAIATAAAVIAGSIYFRSATIWLEWLNALRAMPREIVPLEVGNFALAVVVRERTGLDAALLLLLAGAAALAAVAFRWKPGSRADAALIPLGCVLFLLSSPLVWLHYLLLTVPLVIWLLRPAEGSGVLPRQLAGVVALALLAVTPWDALMPSVLEVATFANAGLLIAFVATLHDLAGDHSSARME
ncbi:MAG TPA: glycosyltransferase 87 family protein [Thermoanaerobaculia bacterium]|nr:glycosyltransferase 87 family protein [Thermoanaerobaculia bacterium]